MARALPMITQQQKAGFYREWSARAAREAIASRHDRTRERCAQSAATWSLVADAIEAGDDQKVRHLTHNLSFWASTILLAGR